jgi:pimeloyl-ACP methyl ester carboxylesterase
MPELLVPRDVRSFDGTELSVYASPAVGDATSAVLLIGPPGAPPLAWRHQTAYLAPRFRVVTWDWRGLGRSRKPSDPRAFSVSDHAHDAAAVLAAVGAKTCAVVAWGEGAEIALDLVLRARAAVSHVALVGGRYGGPFAKSLGIDHSPGLVPLALRAARPALDRIARTSLAPAVNRRLGLAAATLDDDLFVEIAARRAELDPSALTAITEALARHADAPAPETMTQPVLVVTPTRDPLSSLLAARRLARRLPLGELFVIEGATGWAPIEFPELINLRIEKFLDRNGFV